MSKHGYHKTKIKKGQVGKLSKIFEEVNELKDAKKQKSKIIFSSFKSKYCQFGCTLGSQSEASGMY